MKIISFGTLKGGTSKTTTSFNVAGILAERGYKILAIDVDPQANLTTNFGLDETVEGFRSVKDIFEDKNANIEDIVCKSPIKELPNLDVIPSCIMLTSTEMKLVSLAARENTLRNYINRNLDFFNQYDYIIIDTNPSMSIVNQNAFAVSDFICLTNVAGMNSYKGTELFMALWSDISDSLGIKNNIKGILATQIRKGTNMAKEFLEFLYSVDDIKDLLFKTYIPINVTLSEAELENKPINLYDRTCSGYQAYCEFVDELLEKLQEGDH